MALGKIYTELHRTQFEDAAKGSGAVAVDSKEGRTAL